VATTSRHWQSQLRNIYESSWKREAKEAGANERGTGLLIVLFVSGVRISIEHGAWSMEKIKNRLIRFKSFPLYALCPMLYAK
jgi:hypothetical protein